MIENDEKGKNRTEEIGIWLEEIKTAKKREKSFLEGGKEIVEIYEAEKNSPFNILYSNTETLLPALFSETPRPVIQRRFHDADPLAKVVSEASQRMLEYLCDTDDEDIEPFKDAVSDAVLDGLLPGRGVTSVKYDADVNESEENISTVNNETVFVDSVCWDRVYFGYARKWINTPWMTYEKYLDKAEAEALFDELPADIHFTTGEEDEEESTENEDKGKRKTILVYQVWDKSDKKVKYITPQYKDNYLKVQDDPLGLKGFFNCPKPIQFVKKSKNQTPTALYKLYENQAKELNKIQLRLNRVIDAIKVRGAYDGQLGDELAEILKGDDNELIPTDKMATLASQGGLDKSIWLLPVEKLIVVAQQLYVARESCKQVIYEITGISDIVRGQSKASETLGAQKIKESWGTMRLKRLQKEVQRYSLDLMKIMLEIAATKFSELTWKEMTNLPYPTSKEKAQAVDAVKASVMSQQQPDPMLIQLSQMPSWKEITDVLTGDKKGYRIDIETNSTLDVEATEDKEHVAEFMNAMAQFMNGMMPMIENGVMPFPVAKQMMLGVVRRYRFGRDVEDELKKMEEPKPKQSPEMEKQAKEFQQAQQKLMNDQQQFKDEQQKAGDALDDQFRKLEAEKMQLDFDKKLATMQLKHIEAMNSSKQNMDEIEAKSALKEMLVKHKSEIQSMLDKHKTSIAKVNNAAL